MGIEWQENKAAVDLAFDSAFNAPNGAELTGFDEEYATTVEGYRQVLQAIGFSEAYDRGAVACDYAISEEHGNSRTLSLEILSERMANGYVRWIPATQEFLRTANPQYQVCLTTSFAFRKGFTLPRGYALLVVRSMQLLASFSTEEMRQLFGASLARTSVLKRWLSQTAERLASVGLRVRVVQAAGSILQAVDAKIIHRDGGTVLMVRIQNCGKCVAEGNLHISFDGDEAERVICIDALSPGMGLICSEKADLRRVRKASVRVESHEIRSVPVGYSRRN